MLHIVGTCSHIEIYAPERSGARQARRYSRPAVFETCQPQSSISTAVVRCLGELPTSDIAPPPPHQMGIFARHEQRAANAPPSLLPTPVFAGNLSRGGKDRCCALDPQLAYHTGVQRGGRAPVRPPSWHRLGPGDIPLEAKLCGHVAVPIAIVASCLLAFSPRMSVNPRVRRMVRVRMICTRGLV